MKKEQKLKKVYVNSLPKYSDLHKALMKNPEFVKAKKETEPEYQLIRSILNKRLEKNISQKMLAKRMGTGQSAVSRLESGEYNPSFKFLQKLAKALDSELIIKFK